MRTPNVCYEWSAPEGVGPLTQKGGRTVEILPRVVKISTGPYYPGIYVSISGLTVKRDGSLGVTSRNVDYSDRGSWSAPLSEAPEWVVPMIEQVRVWERARANA